MIRIRKGLRPATRLRRLRPHKCKCVFIHVLCIYIQRGILARKSLYMYLPREGFGSPGARHRNPVTYLIGGHFGDKKDGGRARVRLGCPVLGAALSPQAVGGRRAPG